MAEIQINGSERFRNGINTALRNIRGVRAGNAVLESIRQRQFGIIFIELRGNNQSCSMSPNADANVAFLTQQQSQRASAYGSPIRHRAGHLYSYRGIGGGAGAARVRISPRDFCDNRTLQVTLAHELVHGLRILSGSQIYSPMVAWDNYEEFVACLVENVMRSELRLRLRVNHGFGVDPVFQEFWRNANQERQSQAAATTQPGVMRERGALPTGPIFNQTQVESYMESIKTDREALRSLSELFAGRYSNRIGVIRYWNNNLFDRLRGFSNIPFNPFRDC
ncbi:MAG: M91 family zinc metallopeptidase [Pyrinomonadaceae bacterium]